MEPPAPRPRPYRLQPPVVREAPLHRQIADMLRIEIAPAGRISPHSVIWFSVDIASYSGVAPGLRTARGVIAGVPDLFVLHLGRAYLIEIKARDGELSEAQRTFMAAGLCGAVHVGVACSCEDVLALLDSWGVPRARRVRVAA